jgi:hypothetical protein
LASFEILASLAVFAGLLTFTGFGVLAEAAALAGAARLGFAAAGDALVVFVGVDFLILSLAMNSSSPDCERFFTIASYSCNVPLFQFGDIQRPAC